MTKDEKLDKLSSEYLKVFLSFALNKLRNIGEAEELAQEIAYQCVIAINRDKIENNFNAYIMSIAYNTFKRWCKRKKTLSLDSLTNVYTNIVSDEIPVIEKLVCDSESDKLKIAVSQLSDNYRKVIVFYYYEGLSVSEIAKKLSLTKDMVKFYLRAGRQKIKEKCFMNHIGEKSYKPSEFSVYKSAIDFSKVDVWHVFSRKLPCQIALICHDKSRTVEEISAETGTPTVYIEDELNLLIDAGVIIKPIKNKYRTNFSILKKDEVEQIKKEFLNFYKLYIPYVVSVYNKYLNEIKKSGLFKFEASNNQIAWYYALHISAFDTIDYNFTANDYPQILSCGSRAFIFAEESSGSEMAAGRTPTFLDNCTVYPCDVVAFGKIRCQLELRDKKKAQALYDIYIGHLNEEDREIYSELISQGYALKKDKKLYCNVAVSNKTNRELFNTINNELLSILKPMCFDIRKNITKIVGLSVPEHLSSYIKGFTETWIAFYSGVYLKEELLRTGFILIPDFDDNTPLACEIYEN